MSFFVIKDGTVVSAFETRQEAQDFAGGLPGSRVIGEEWIALETVRNRVNEARALLEEVSGLIDPQELEQMRSALRQLEDLLDGYLNRLDLEPGG